MGTPPAVVVLATLAAPRDPSLDELLGPDGARALREAIALRARRWAARIAPDLAFEATSPGAAVAAIHGHAGPVLLVADDVPGLDEELARAALDDLAEGAFAAFAPSSDGSPYLVALPAADADLIELAGASFEALMSDARAAERGVGMLRSERRLVSAADALALAVDPVTPDDLRHLLPRR